MTTKAWSENLAEATRGAIADCAVAPDGLLHMKNCNGGYGSIRLEDLAMGRLVVEDKCGGDTCSFGSVSELIAAGWAID